MARKDDDKIKKLITIEVREQRVEDTVFLALYNLISNGKKKETIQKSLIFLLKKGNVEVLEMLFGDNLEEAKTLAKKRTPRAKKVPRKRMAKKNTTEEKPPIEDKVVDIKEEFKELSSHVLPTQSDKKEETIIIETIVEEPKIEVIKDDISSDNEIDKKLESEDTGSSTTQKKRGEDTVKFKKRKEKKEKDEQLSDNEKDEKLKKRMAEIKELGRKRQEESDARKKNNMVGWGKD